MLKNFKLTEHENGFCPWFFFALKNSTNQNPNACMYQYILQIILIFIKSWDNNELNSSPTNDMWCSSPAKLSAFKNSNVKQKQLCTSSCVGHSISSWIWSERIEDKQRFRLKTKHWRSNGINLPEKNGDDGWAKEKEEETDNYNAKGVSKSKKIART